MLRADGKKVGIIAVDPTSPFTGGALLGDRIRMQQHFTDEGVFIRSIATRGHLGGLSRSTGDVLHVLRAARFDLVLLETVGVGQDELEVTSLADTTLVVMAPGLGDDIQAIKAGILEVADLLVINKADLPGADMLALHLGTVFPNTDDRDLRLLKTIASENQGLEKLLERIQLLEENYRQDNTLQQRRQNSYTLEIMDWALELLRPRISNLIVPDSGTDPRVSAQNIIEQLGQEFSK